MAEKAEVFITSSVNGRGAYGVRADTDDTVYFPVGIAEAMDLEEFETVQAIVVANDRAEPPWRAIKVRRLEEEAIPSSK